MLNRAKTKFAKYDTKTIIFTGGINEKLTNLEINPGELILAENYTEVDGVDHGYTSIAGYERYDGQPSPTDVAVVTDIDGNVTDDTAREAARALIQPIPGFGDTRGVHYYQGDVYGFRDNLTSTTCDMYKATATGWSGIAGTGMNPGGSVQAINARFSLFDSYEENMFIVDGVSDPIACDGAIVTPITTPITTASPTRVGAWKNRLFLAYPGGHLLFSAVGDPTDWTTTSVTGEIYFGEDIEEIVVTPGGALVVFTKNSIKVVYYESTTADFLFRVEEFSTSSGAKSNTVQRLLGTLYFADDRGVTTLENVDSFGDFSASSLSKKVQNTYITYKNVISASIVDRVSNQYILFFDINVGGYLGIVFTFDDEKKLKGATFLKYDHKVLHTTEGKNDDRTTEMYFGSTDGYIYKMNTGTSFDGAEINTRMITSFYHYGTPRRWKRFKRLTFEISAEKHTSFLFKQEYSYRSTELPTTVSRAESVIDTGGTYGVDKWGEFVWGGAYVAQVTVLPLGFGINMNTTLKTADKYIRSHTIHNMITDYSVGSIHI